jgi:YHYH protein/Secretion system C-terminal sorting domain
MNKIYTLTLVFFATILTAQTGPEVTSWIVNTTGATGYGGLETNVQQVQYSTANVYVSCTCIPGYDIGPWNANPNTPANQDFCFKITRSPQENTGTKTATGLGHTGVWSNGVSIFNAKDAMSYNNQNVWYRNAYYFEGASFDDCLGHPAPNGEYHHHVNPTCLYDDTDSSQHAPIIGYAFDGFPIYGAWAYTNTNGTGAIKRMRSSYRTRAISNRTTLPNGTVLQANQYGPELSVSPLGAYLEDYEYVQGFGDLDEHNGRFSITPDYPNGTYAYFVTLDDALDPVYPYIIGPNYYGIVTPGNTGPQSGHNVPNEPVTTYIPGTTGLDNSTDANITIGPNPMAGYVLVDFSATNQTAKTIELYSIQGSLIYSNTSPAISQKISMDNHSNGVYFLRIYTANGGVITRKLVKA